MVHVYCFQLAEFLFWLCKFYSSATTTTTTTNNNNNNNSNSNINNHNNNDPFSMVIHDPMIHVQALLTEDPNLEFRMNQMEYTKLQDPAHSVRLLSAAASMVWCWIPRWIQNIPKHPRLKSICFQHICMLESCLQIMSKRTQASADVERFF